MMLVTQVKGFTLLILVLLIVDALAFHGQYRLVARDKLAAVVTAITPTDWGMGGGRNWASPGQPRPRRR